MATLDSSPVNITGAAADLSAKQYRFGKLTSSGPNVCSVAGERADFIIGNRPTSGKAVDAWVERAPMVELGGTVTLGDQLTTDANGKAVTASAGQYVNAIASESGVSGDVIGCLRPLSPYAAAAAGVSVSASGAIPPTAKAVFLTVSGTKAYTLADGVIGAEMVIECVSAASTPLGTLTIATPFGSEPSTHVFTTAGQSLRLVMSATGWKVIGKRRAGSLTVVVGTDVLTGYDLVETYNLSVTGTVSSTSTKAIPDGLVIGELIQVRCTTAASTPAGSIDGTYKSLAAAATTHAAYDSTADYFVATWDGAAWLVTASNSVTFS